jgi:hypothetical protein
VIAGVITALILAAFLKSNNSATNAAVSATSVY